MTSEWNATDYHRVSDPQFHWGQAVLRRLDLRGDERAIDLGCGTGRLTKELVARLPRGQVIGLDASAQMLEQAREYLARCEPPVRFVRTSLPLIPIAGWADVAFSTATFHWIRDHATLFANIFQTLRPGGVLHAQCGGERNLEAARTPAREVMHLPRFAHWFRNWQPIWEFAGAEQTADRLEAAGFTDIATSLEPAPIVFEDEAAYRAFVSTVVFRLHRAALPEELRDPFLDEIVGRVSALPQRFTLDYRRLNIRARRPSGAPGR